MAYISVESLKTHLGITNASDDAWLATLISAAQVAIDRVCGRSFEAATATRTYGREAVEGGMLRLDHDLLTVTTLTNGDGSAIGSSDYVLWPRNLTPKWAIRLDSTQSWSFTDLDSVISVTGEWGYSTTAPADIEQICREVAAQMYRSYDASTDRDLRQVASSLIGEFAQRLVFYRAV